MPIPTKDETTTMTIDEKIQPQTLSAPATFDISQPVVPGHDMVVNHLDGTQELATGNEAVEIAAREAVKGSNVPLSEVQGQVAPETLHRSVSDPEVNGPDQELLKAEKATQTHAAPAQPKNPEVIKPVKGASTIDPVTSEPTSADVANV